MAALPTPEELSPYFLKFEELPCPIDWPGFFGHEGPVEVEVGPGKGLHLARAATDRPNHAFLGIELAAKYARKAADRLKKRSLSNARVVAADARRVLTEFIPSHSVRTVHVYFPDPWWKKRHKKRRVFSADFLQQIYRILEPGGELQIATDVEEYFEVMTGLVADHPGFVRMDAPMPTEPTHELDYLTNFERKFRIEGRAIHRAAYRSQEIPA